MAQKFLQLIRARFFNSAADTAIDVGVKNETNARLAIDAGGKIQWGDGTLSVDTNLYRPEANTLQTDDTFKSAGLYVKSVEIDTAGAENGEFLSFDGTKFLPSTFPTNEPMGFENRLDSVISFNNSTRVFSIAPSSSSYTIWCFGKKFVKSSSLNITIANTSGFYYIYFDSSGTLSSTTVSFDFATQTTIAFVLWDATLGTAQFFADERHGIVLDGKTHEYLHKTRGAAYSSGFDALTGEYTGDGTSNSHMNFTLTAGSFYDEDLLINVNDQAPASNQFNQELSPLTTKPFYLNPAGSFIRGSETTYLTTVGTVAQYNFYNTSTSLWELKDHSNNKYGIVWVIATNETSYPVITILGQTEYNNIGDSQAASWFDMIFSTLPTPEFLPLYKIIYEVKTSFTNTPKAAIRYVEDIRPIESGVGLGKTKISALIDADPNQVVYKDAANVATGSANLTFDGTNLVVSGTATASSGIVTLTSNGVPSANIANGGLAVDTSTSNLYIRSNNTWNLNPGIVAPAVIAPTNTSLIWLDTFEYPAWPSIATGDEILRELSEWTSTGTATATRSALGATFTTFRKAYGGVLHPDGKIYTVPNEFTNNIIIAIDTIANTATVITSSIYINTTAALALNNEIYLGPASADTIAYYAPPDFYNHLPGNTSDSNFWYYWKGAVLAPNGKIYMAPDGSDSVLVIDPILKTFSQLTMGLTFSDDLSQWSSLVLAPNGKIYAIPANSTDILIIDPATNTAIRSNMGADLTGTGKWRGGVLGPNGKIYGIPSSATDILIIDPVANTATRSAMGADLTGSGKWYGGALGADGKIYGMPSSATDILIIDPRNNTATRSTLGASLTGTLKWRGGILAPSGKIYGLPYNSMDILVINTLGTGSSRISSSSVPLSPYLNKF